MNSSSSSDASSSSANGSFAIPGPQLGVMDNMNSAALNKLVATTRDETVVMRIPARSSLLEGKEYNVTIGEIKRRMASPERLGINDLVKLLKESKIPENMKNLRQKLEERGLIQDGDLFCEDFVLTGFLSLSEAEAMEMAADFVRLTEESFPVEDLANQMAAFPGMDTEMTEAVIEHLDFLIDLYQTDGSFDGNHSRGMHSEFMALKRGMKRVSNATHGFAKPAYVSFLSALKAVAVEVQIILQKQNAERQMAAHLTQNPGISSTPVANPPGHIGAVDGFPFPKFTLTPLTPVEASHLIASCSGPAQNQFVRNEPGRNQMLARLLNCLNPDVPPPQQEDTRRKNSC